jgi:yecA family protein
MELEGRARYRGSDGRGMTQELFTYDEVDEILRLDGRNDFVGISAIDGLIAAVAAGPAYIEQKVWLPHVFAGPIPEGAEGTLEHRLVQTILHRHDEVAGVLAQKPDGYLPLFMNHEGSVITEHWGIGFMMGLGMRSKAWGPIMISGFRMTLAPILALNAIGRKLMPDVPDHKLDIIKATAHTKIADAVVALYHHCLKDRSESRRLVKLRAGRR